MLDWNIIFPIYPCDIISNKLKIFTKNTLFVHMGHVGIFWTSVSQHTNTSETSICSINCPPCPTFVFCFIIPHIHFLMSPSSVIFGTFLSHPVSRIVAYFPLCPLTSSHFPTRQTVPLYPPNSDFIMSVVRESVASLGSHGRQLHSEVGHMVRWVTRADSNRPRDGQRDQAAVRALHCVNTTWAGELGGVERVSSGKSNSLRWHNMMSWSHVSVESCEMDTGACEMCYVTSFYFDDLNFSLVHWLLVRRHKLNLRVFSKGWMIVSMARYSIVFWIWDCID